MDPNANIARQRELALSILALEGSLEIREPGKPRRAVWHYADELAELVIALDEWRLKGGFDPYGSIDPRLVDINKTMAAIDTDDRDNTERELAFAMLAVAPNDAATLRWLAACCAKRAGDLTGYEPN